jgi:hypothetical protein
VLRHRVALETASRYRLGVSTTANQFILGFVICVLIVVGMGCVRKSLPPTSGPSTRELAFEVGLSPSSAGFLLKDTTQFVNPRCGSTVAVVAHMINPGPDTVSLAVYGWLWYVYRDSSGRPDWVRSNGNDRVELVQDSMDCPAISIGLGEQQIKLGEARLFALDSTGFLGYTLYLHLAAATSDASTDPACAWNRFPRSTNDSIVIHGCSVVSAPADLYRNCPP